MGKKNKKTEGPERSRRIVVAMSGGVDSSVAAALLKRAGFDVAGVFMKFWKDGKAAENRCCSIESEKMARLVAKKIGIPFYVINVEKEFKKKVVDYFLAEYKKGNTPNPCVVCNKEIKFGLLLEKALKMGADYVATGHYASIEFPSLRGRSKATDEAIQSYRLPRRLRTPRNDVKLFVAQDKEKDQSYFLWQLNQKQLKHILFPVGNYTKPQVRKLAKKFKLPTAQTPESQEVCFVQTITADFLKKYIKSKPGPVIEQAQNGVNKIIGRHQGLHFYTIGQRKGIGLSGGPFYVVAQDFKKNNLIVSKNKKDLESKELVAKNVNWLCPSSLRGRSKATDEAIQMRVEVKVRYRAKSASAKIFILGKDKAKVIFDKPQRAITPGQSAVFYRGQELLGGGVIK